MNTVTITGPKELVAILANAINVEQDATKVATMREALMSALSLCTVTVRNDTNAGDRWA